MASLWRWFGFGGGKEKASPEPENEGGKTPDSQDQPIWAYSKQYKSVYSESVRNPPTAIGSPTFVWHIGVWPRSSYSEEAGVTKPERAQKYLKSVTRNLFEELSTLLASLQKKGCVGGWRDDFGIKTFNTEDFELYSERRPVGPSAQKPSNENEVFRFVDVKPQSIAFTLWWKDGGALNASPGRTPDEADLRVVVLAQSHVDHFTLTFHIDAAKPYGAAQIEDTAHVPEGTRRWKIGRMLDHIRGVAGDQMRRAHVDHGRLPEKDVDEPCAQQLLEAADYFYDGIWREFCEDFELEFEAGAEAGPRPVGSRQGKKVVGRRFADLRGVVMSVKGMETSSDAERIAAAANLREKNNVSDERPFPDSEGHHPDRPDPATAYTGFGKFDTFDETVGEPNGVLKSYWPFIRRVIRWADYRQLVGCGILDWRALYVSPMGAEDSFLNDQEFPSRQAEVPGNHLPLGEGLAGNERAEDLILLEKQRNFSRPSRYILFTKGEPNREQIGRFVERINALTTMRLFALKYVSDIKNASSHLRVLGAALDGVLSDWSAERRRIEADYTDGKDKLEAYRANSWAYRALDRVFRLGGRTPTLSLMDLSQARINLMNALILEKEGRLIELGGQLDHIFKGGVGRLSYAINRSRYFSEEFKAMYPSLEERNIEGWMNYTQFVERGPKPAFDFIASAGDRLVAFRRRLQEVTETIQTTALVVETEATRANTDTLRNFAWTFRAASFSTLIFAMVSAFSFMYDAVQYQCRGFFFDVIWWFGHASPRCIQEFEGEALPSFGLPQAVTLGVLLILTAYLVIRLGSKPKPKLQLGLNGEV